MVSTKNRFKLRVMSLGIAVLLFISLALPTSAANLGYVFSFSHSNYDYLTHNVPERILPYFWSMGYNAGEYTNNSVASAYRVLPNSKAFVFIGDAAPGILAFMNSSGEYSFMYGTHPNLDPDDRALSNLASNSLANVRCVILMATFTGRDNSTYGNLVDYMYSKGAKAVIGWDCSIDPRQGGADWLEAFFMYSDQGYSMNLAAGYADSLMRDNLDSTQYDEVIDRYTRGALNMYLEITN